MLAPQRRPASGGALRPADAAMPLSSGASFALSDPVALPVTAASSAGARSATRPSTAPPHAAIATTTAITITTAAPPADPVAVAAQSLPRWRSARAVPADAIVHKSATKTNRAEQRDGSKDEGAHRTGPCTLHCTALHCTALDCTALRSPPLCCTPTATRQPSLGQRARRCSDNCRPAIGASAPASVSACATAASVRPALQSPASPRCCRRPRALGGARCCSRNCACAATGWKWARPAARATFRCRRGSARPRRGRARRSGRRCWSW